MKPSGLVLLFALAAPLAAQERPLTHTPQPTRPAIDTLDLITRVYILADDSMQGRGPGTAGAERATAYIARELERLHLVPGGDSGTYFQYLPLVRFNLGPDTRLLAGSVPLAAGTDYLLNLHTDANRFPPIEGLEIVYGGIAGDSARMLHADQARGKMVLLDLAVRSDGTRRFIPPMLLTRMPQLQEAAGIALIGLEDVPEGMRRALESSAMVMLHDDTSRVQIQMLLSRAAADRVLPGRDSLPRGAAGPTLHGDLDIRQTSAGARNVIGILPGSDPERKGQVVAMGAHSDHVGMAARPVDHDSVRAYNLELERRGLPGPARGSGGSRRSDIVVNVDSLHALRPARPDSIYNGADDDGSGSSALLEIAEAFATGPERPRRTLLFIWHTGEEMGLWGSAWHSTHTAVPRDSIVAYLNMDMVGRGGPEDVAGGGPWYLQLIGPRRLSTELGDQIEALNKERAQPMQLDYTYDANGHPYNRYCRSDHAMYARFGIPVTQFSAGYHVDYHQLTDEPQYINYPHLVHIAQFIHDVAERIANLDHRLVVDQPRPDPNAPCRQ